MSTTIAYIFQKIHLFIYDAELHIKFVNNF